MGLLYVHSFKRNQKESFDNKYESLIPSLTNLSFKFSIKVRKKLECIFEFSYQSKNGMTFSQFSTFGKSFIMFPECFRKIQLKDRNKKKGNLSLVGL